MKSIIKFLILLVALSTLALCFTACDAIGYNISFVVDGEEIDRWEGMRENRAVKPPTPKNKDGYIFDGWYSDADMTEYFTSGIFNYNKSEHKNLTIYGKYVPEDEYVAKVKTIDEFYYAVKKDYNIELLSDIDAKDAGKFEGEDKTQSYTSTIDGKGYTIHNLTVIDRSGIVYRNKGVIKNLNFANFKMLSSMEDEYYNTGGFTAFNSGTIENCKISGTMGYNNNGYYRSALYTQYFGCVAAMNEGFIKNCDVEVKFSTNTSGYSPYSYAGGIVGYNYENATVEGSCYIGVGIASYRYAHLGGIAGANEGNIVNCISGGILNASTNITAYVGGIVGNNKESSTIESSYSTTQISVSSMYQDQAAYTAYAGGLAGYNYGKIGNSFFDSSLSPYNRPEREIYAGYIAGYNKGTTERVFYGESTGFKDGSCDVFCDIGELTLTENLKSEAWIRENLWENTDEWSFDGNFPMLKR